MNALGVIGGMGPLATADFLKKLTVNTVATCDQAHLPVMVYGDCMVPDRTECVTRGGASPLPSLLRAVKSLCLLEVKALAIPCNMAHHWIGELAQVANVPFINMIDATIRAVENNNGHTKRVGVLSTAGTYAAGLYRDKLQNQGFIAVEPSVNDFNTLINPAIELVKAGQIAQSMSLFEKAADALLRQGAEQIILGCTEIPLGMKKRLTQHPDRYVDSTNALAFDCLRFFNKPVQVVQRGKSLAKRAGLDIQ